MTTVTAIVLSYARPRMLREALATVAANRPDEAILVDDGSAFDAVGVALEYADLAAWVAAPPLTVAERLVTPRLGSLINRAIAVATGDVIAYLCDDDLWAPGWLDAVRDHWDAHPAATLVRGEWRVFRDGEAVSAANPVCPLDGRGMTTGNFAHRRTCGARWPEDTIASHDDLFLWNLHRQGVDTFAVPCVGCAGWRREHQFNALHHAVAHGYGPTGEAFLSRGWLE